MMMSVVDNSVYFNFLKKKVLSVAGLKNISAADCKVLSILLRNKTNKYLSETTVKRIYGFAKTRFAVSPYTKDILAEFCGFDDWHNYTLSVSISGNSHANEPQEQIIPINHSIWQKSFLDTLMIRVLLLIAVYNEDGAIEDFMIEMANKEMEKATGRKDLAGKLYSLEYPGVKQAGLYELMLKVMETGQPEQTRYYYPFDGLNSWYSSLLVRTSEGLWTAHYDLPDIKI